MVLDPFCGSGSTCLAAKLAGRKYIGYDIKPEYVELAEKRLSAIESNDISPSGAIKKHVGKGKKRSLTNSPSKEKF